MGEQINYKIYEAPNGNYMFENKTIKLRNTKLGSNSRLEKAEQYTSEDKEMQLIYMNK